MLCDAPSFPYYISHKCVHARESVCVCVWPTCCALRSYNLFRLQWTREKKSASKQMNKTERSNGRNQNVRQPTSLCIRTLTEANNWSHVKIADWAAKSVLIGSALLTVCQSENGRCSRKRRFNFHSKFRNFLNFLSSFDFLMLTFSQKNLYQIIRVFSFNHIKSVRQQ